ncbi:FG-GAP-like repeat-containing protein [Dyadobacter sandarakinus]|uniref:VCBS repeat-containing protein n=1 Tax=Dyadobacter sandarakinus TaxID=2747268 RepID=A0ABX7I521_9BACT|nr:FG-GAP-like repeat-containing protein [Dyadobacter sandarakinus]QRR00126.1 VCBS repeat-containing protein [Dyadobacter sandarakinus]
MTFQIKLFYATLLVTLFCTGLQTRGQVKFVQQPLPTGLEYTPQPGIGFVQVADINGDGFPDVLYTATTAGPLVYLQNNNGESFSTPELNPFADFISSTPPGFALNISCSIADFDGDGDLDIWNRLPGASNDNYLLNDKGVYHISPVPQGMEFTLGGVGFVQVADINGDGLPDILYTATQGAALVYLQNNNGESFSTPQTNPFADFVSSTPAGFALNVASSISDFDGDGDLDIWTRVNGSNNDNYLKNDNGIYQISPVPPGMEFTLVGVGFVQVADMNGDGLPDVLYTATQGAALVYLQNNNGESFSTPQTNPFADFVSSTPQGFALNVFGSIADFDGDGDLDIWSRLSNPGNDIYISGLGTAPVLLSTIPARNASDVNIDADILLNFDENVFTGSGNISIVNALTDQVYETFPAAGPQITGVGTNTITINPSTNLAINTSYYIVISNGALIDSDGLIVGTLDPVRKVRRSFTSRDFLPFTTNASLPVTLTSFNVVKTENALLLSWKTALEINSERFDIQRSANGKNWQNLASIAGAGSNNTPASYEFKDLDPLQGINLYRLKIVDLDGIFTYSSIRQITFNELNTMAAFPNPAQAVTTLRMGKQYVGTKMNLVNMIGQTVKTINVDNEIVNVDLSGFSPGLYFLKAGNAVVIKLIKQ